MNTTLPYSACNHLLAAAFCRLSEPQSAQRCPSSQSSPSPEAAIPVLLYVPQVAWYSFQFLCEELGEQLAGLHAAVNAVLRRLPA